ncbi:amino acid/amide ABC transporter membrane protein 1 (HAAT family) [Tepidamorphus gemmatus]|uniref:Amino acid/amide ABC transporter membrane protein 1 (HAAT family) n=1 Tax=Tepidamorphus gemmatus TaxID=747076 RepID=A0A4R3M7D9_9HYPH|nr:urea ABC transporter permease subunit UrtB [Tepidamorphus gemmatus]TCT09250.1 amino acid/amide ABC transporter membrane protein 1 (HAAT family) [Tepidamorphus gemmatus]
MYLLLARLFAAILLAAVLAAGRAEAQDAAPDLGRLVDGLAIGGFAGTEAAVAALGATGNPAVAPILETLAAGDLYVRKSDGKVFFARRDGADFALTDPLTGEDAGTAGRAAVDKIRVNNSLRRAVRSALAGLTLNSPDASVRLAAARTLFRTPDPEMIKVLDHAIAEEEDAGVRRAMQQARAAIVVTSDAGDADRIAAIATVAARGDQEALAMLSAVAAASDGEVRAAAEAAVSRLEQQRAMWNAAQNVWYGISLGAVLLLAAIGLAITFGVMGVINMAHGEMVMIGAYTTFVVQEIVRAHAPGLFDASVVVALPLAFLVAGAIGVAIERGIIRFLYGRPLETLLATWGLSLILQQAVRTMFGPTNRQVGAPSWMSGAFELGGMAITYNRLVIVLFALTVLLLLVAALKYTAFGLRMRAVTQNRRMAGSMGIRTSWVDAMTFGLGSGIAGIAGVALSQIDNVSPNLGQGYIIDSFMVVVFGGVGNLWGTLVGAMTLGIVNKFLEPYAGAVLGKILVLVFIILFIQKRPRGLFALKGRAVEA